MISCRGDAKMAWAGQRLVCCRGETLGYRTLYVWIANWEISAGFCCQVLRREDRNPRVRGHVRPAERARAQQMPATAW